MFCFRSILQIWIIFIGFRDMNDFMNLGICKHDFKFTSQGASEAIDKVSHIDTGKADTF